MLNVGTAGPFDVRLHHATNSIIKIFSIKCTFIDVVLSNDIYIYTLEPISDNDRTNASDKAHSFHR